jgi:hypothetical protein
VERSLCEAARYAWKIKARARKITARNTAEAEVAVAVRYGAVVEQTKPSRRRLVLAGD